MQQMNDHLIRQKNYVSFLFFTGFFLEMHPFVSPPQIYLKKKTPKLLQLYEAIEVFAFTTFSKTGLQHYSSFKFCDSIIFPYN